VLDGDGIPEGSRHPRGTRCIISRIERKTNLFGRVDAVRNIPEVVERCCGIEAHINWLSPGHLVEIFVEAYAYALSDMRRITLVLMHILIQSLSSYKSSFSYKTSDDAETLMHYRDLWKSSEDISERLVSLRTTE